MKGSFDFLQKILRRIIISIIAVLFVVLGASLATAFLLRTEHAALPAGAIKFQEKQGVTIYTYHNTKAAYENPLETNNSAYVVDGKKVLDSINLKYNEQVAIIAVYKNRIVLLSYPDDWRSARVASINQIVHTNIAELYIVSRNNGAMQFANFHTSQLGDRFVGAAPDGSYLVFSSIAPGAEDGKYYPHLSTVNLNNFWNHYEYDFYPALADIEDCIDDFSVSPDGKHAAVAINDINASDQKTFRGHLYLLDMTKTETPDKTADLSIPYDQMWATTNSLGYDGVAMPFASSIVGWSSPTTVSVTISPGHIETFKTSTP
jgi:hypothetical protein